MAIKDGFRPGNLGVTLLVREAEKAKEFYQAALVSISVQKLPGSGRKQRLKVSTWL